MFLWLCDILRIAMSLEAFDCAHVRVQDTYNRKDPPYHVHGIRFNHYHNVTSRLANSGTDVETSITINVLHLYCMQSTYFSLSLCSSLKHEVGDLLLNVTYVLKPVRQQTLITLGFRITALNLYFFLPCQYNLANERRQGKMLKSDAGALPC